MEIQNHCRRNHQLSQSFRFLIVITVWSLTRLPRISFAYRQTSSATAPAAFMSPNISRTNSSKSSDSEQRLQDQITLPKREYGYAATPFEWTDLIQIIVKEKNLAKLSRSVEQERVYQIYRRELLREWKSIYDHILCSKFGLEKRLAENPTKNDDGRNASLWEAYPPLSEIREVRKVLCPNDFPYHTAPGVEHWCLWKLCDDVRDEEIQQAKQDLRRRLGDVVDFLHWRNPPHLKSLPDIDHVHILCLRETTATPDESNPEINVV